jgi:hypothetical protein
MKDEHSSISEKPIEVRNVRSVLWPWIAIVAILAFTAAVRIRLLQTPLERDEGEFAYMGQLIIQGIPPYQMAYNMKLPGIYAAYALIMAAFGQNIAGIHLGLLLANAIAIVLLFLLTRRLFDNVAAVTAAAGYGLLSLSPFVMGTSAHATQFIVPLALGGTILLLKALDSGKHRLLFASGLCFGLAFLMKQHAIFFIAFAVMYFLWDGTRIHPLNAKRLVGGTALLVIASMIPFAAACSWLYAAGTFANFRFWAISYGSQYVSEISIRHAPDNLLRLIREFVHPWGCIGAMAGIGLTTIFWNRSAKAHWPFLAGMTIFSFLTICPGFYFRGHYAVTFLPIIGILAGIATSSLMQYLSERSLNSVLKWLPALFMLAFLIYPIVRLHFFFFNATPIQACRMMYGTSPFPESIEIAEYIKKHTTVSDRVAVFGSEPQICFYAGRKSATGYIYTYALTEPQIYAAKMQIEMISEIEKAHPKYAVMVNVSTSWGPRSNSDIPILKWADGYLGRNYRVTGVVDIFEDGHYEAYWDEAARRSKPQSQSHVYVLERISE